jgi:hypothetical protein
MTFDNLKNMPKEFLLQLYDTAGRIGFDDHEARQKVREQQEAEWAHLMEPSLADEEKRLTDKIARNLEWMNLLQRAIHERRPAIRRVVAGDVLISEGER